MRSNQGGASGFTASIRESRRDGLGEAGRPRNPAPTPSGGRSVQWKDVEFVGEQEGLAPLAEAARGHVASCSYCQEFVADLANIVSIANELPAEVEPPARVWVSLRAQLELEGIIKAPVIPARGER